MDNIRKQGRHKEEKGEDIEDCDKPYMYDWIELRKSSTASTLAHARTTMTTCFSCLGRYPHPMPTVNRPSQNAELHIQYARTRTSSNAVKIATQKRTTLTPQHLHSQACGELA